jgi:hypothetical protein
MIVFGVCALGVGSLYLVPAIARSPEQIRHSRTNEEPTNSAVGIRPAKPQGSASSTSDRGPTEDEVPADDGGPAKTASGAQPSQPAASRTDDSTNNGTDNGNDRSSGKAKTEASKAGKDSEPPQPIAEIEPSKVTPQQLMVSWPAASDNVGVIGYRIWLNGFEVATTAETRARLRWFNVDSGQHVVQIRAVDAAGNQSRSSPTLVITRPSPEPTDTPTPEPSDSATPDSQSSEPSQPSAESSESSSRTPTDQKPTAEDEHR